MIIVPEAPTAGKPSIVSLLKELSEKTYAKTKQIYESLLRAPGEERPNSKESVAFGVREKVIQSIFGLGLIVGEELRCQYFPRNLNPMVTFEENEVIIATKSCRDIKAQLETYQSLQKPEIQTFGEPVGDQGTATITPPSTDIPEIQITIDVPRGQVSQIMGLMNFLQQKYQSLGL